ncbi:hypothetical protein LZ198_07260 [Myxococcus sp. K15C18031901]|uniref:hypothetical protein n=1 Tax=Myxococcus dinghuensis TaxID=2906761 RepID=UPI0020A73106|nr:hypothetical protein [Myxococcus dinghuensis]MCP3098673.1 hypothetical protein [Myxococcus dinghuensis]
MALSRWVVGLSALLMSACGGPVGSEAPSDETGTVEQRSEEPGGTWYGNHRTYYFDAAKTIWAGAEHYDCQGYGTVAGQVTPYYTDSTFICS